MPEPQYIAANCSVAYQLHWSLSVFSQCPIPAASEWREALSLAVEADGVRLLEFSSVENAAGQFFLSSRPDVAPAAVVRSIKGRLQYLLRNTIPQLWRRHYAITSVGSANNEVLQSYVGRQVEHHPQADARVVERLKQVQFHDSGVLLDELRSSAHGRFTNSLHIVLENADHLNDVREEWLVTTREMIIRACRKKGWLLSRVGIVANHLHILLGCDVDEIPQDVALSLMNNLAFAHGMKRVFESSFYLGTFGPYDHQAIRNRLPNL
ncbi:transposase [Anatilimnocola floriformis]|uniref:transposase n=1 Tax=Anatilimnocola floriformis TaxID=2948575 RepID=UPI0020C45C63|nr:transposase [Anatilimnocola floriformis]